MVYYIDSNKMYKKKISIDYECGLNNLMTSNEF